MRSQRSPAEKAIAEAIRAMKEAKPKFGFRPSTCQEWAKALAATEKMAYAMYLMDGLPEKKARELAHAMHSGAAGRLLLQMSFDAAEVDHE